MYPRDGQYTILDDDSLNMSNYPREPVRGYARNGDLMPNQYKKYEILQNRQVNQWGGNLSPVHGTMMKGEGRGTNAMTVGDVNMNMRGLSDRARQYIQKDWNDTSPDDLTYQVKFPNDDLIVNYVQRPLGDVNNIEAIKYNESPDDPDYEPADDGEGRGRTCLGVYEHFSSCPLCAKLASVNCKIYIIVIAILIVIIALLLLKK